MKNFLGEFSYFLIIVLGIFIFFIFLFFNLDSFHVSGGEDNSFSVAMNVWPGFSSVFLALEKNFFNKQGVDMKVNVFDEYAVSLEAFKEGGFDGFLGVYSDALLLAMENYSVSVVYAVDFSNGGDIVISSPDIKEISDLKGKTIGATIGSFSHFFILDLLKKNGLGEFDVNIVDVSESDVFDMLDSGYIDAGHTMEPIQSKAVAGGYNLLATSADVPNSIIDVLVVKNDVIKKNPEKICKIVNALFVSEKYMRKNPEESYSYISVRSGVDPYDLNEDLKGIKILNKEENQELFDKTQEESLYDAGQFILDFYKDSGIVNRSFVVDDFIDSRFVSGMC